MQPVNQVVPVGEAQANLQQRLNVAAETLCRLRGQDPFALSSERDQFRTNLQATIAQCTEAFWIAEALRIAGLAGLGGASDRT